VAGQDPRNLGCTQDYTYDYNSQGHEWLVYRRTEEVLNAMQTYGDITQKQHDQALQEVYDLLLYHRITSWLYTGNNFNHVTDLAPHFVDFLRTYLYQNFGIQNPLQSGLKIYTTLDLNLQNYAQVRAKYYIDGDPKQGNTFNIPWGDYICGFGGAAADTPCVGAASLAQSSNVHNAAVVAMDAHTGDILAMVGSVDYSSTDPQTDGAVNVATSPYRSMGSSTKPLVYTTAFQMGWTPGIMMQDQPICFPGNYDPTQPKNFYAPNCKGYYTPTNFEDQSYTGRIPLRYGLANSLNIPATEALSFVGDSPTTSATFIAAVRRLGVTSVTASAMGPATALGAQDISLLQLTNAYQTFADNGKHVPYRAVLAIESPTGEPLWVAPTPQAAQVLSPQTAYMLTSILTDQQARIPDFNSPNPLEFDDPNLGLDPAIQDELSYMTGKTDPTSDQYMGGYGDNLNFPAVAAKTGTSQGETGPRDIVTMGYSPYMVLGVWAGNASTDLDPNIIGIAGAGYIFHDVMAWAITHYHWTAGVQFPIPAGMAMGQFNCTTGLAPYKGTTKITPCQEIPGIGEPICPKKYPECATRLYSGNGTRIDQDWYIQGQQWLES
ncbi:MAG TPA: penicillin-binding transpeptidase domain-containing protein, partial [Ktedonobacterales bacterium]|nr:penicillin-binding transpeptidase domain-containing protein [Ktedonobacterales bacterium]